MLNLASKYVKEKGKDFSLLEALIRETFERVAGNDPAGVQTGPAARGDQETMQKHLRLLKGHPEWEKMYTFVSRDIERSRNTKSEPERGND